MKTRPARAAAWIFALNTAVAMAQENQHVASSVPAFETLDRNNDGRLSRTEAGYNRHLERIFVDSDVDGDGFVTRSEYESANRRVLVSEAQR